MSELSEAVERFGWRRVESAAHVWAGRMRRHEEGCPTLVGAWRRALADVVVDAVTIHGVYGLDDLAGRIVTGMETPTPDRDVIDDRVARWSCLVRALDVHSGAPSSFPCSVLGAGDLAAIAAVAEELDAERRHIAATARPISGVPLLSGRERTTRTH